MSRALVTATLIKPPKELEQFLDDPPLVGTERREDYENFFSVIAMAVKPVDAIEWLLVVDVAYLSWEIRRERRIKAEIIKLRQKEASRRSWPSPGQTLRSRRSQRRILARLRKKT